MTDDRIPESGPLFDEAPTPEHGPNFWRDLESTLASEAAPTSTRQMPAAGLGHVTDPYEDPVAHAAYAEPHGGPRRDRPRSTLPLAIAAAVLAFVGLGVFVAMQLGDDGGSRTEIVAGPTEVADAAPTPALTPDSPDTGTGAGLDGPSDESADDEPVVTEQAPAPTPESPAPQASAEPSGQNAGEGAGGEAGVPAPTGVEAPTAAPTTLPTAAPTPEPTPTVAPIPDFRAAFGAEGEPDHVPLDQGVPADGTYLANWTARALTYYGATDPALNCASAKYGEILYVNGSGITQSVHDPVLRFSGEVSHMTVHDEEPLAAWVVSCGTQLELYTAELDSSGIVTDVTLTWFGEGAVESALVQWRGSEVSLSAIEPGASAFSVTYDVESGLLGRNGGPSRIILEEGAPAERSLTPLAATSDAGLTYFAGRAEPGTVSACEELFGSGVSDMLWLRQGEGQWLPAVAGDFPVGTVTAAAIEPDFLQFAFADVCPDEAGRVVVGTQLPDGRIGDPVTLDLTPYVPGFVSGLFWIDEDTLRIETDNSDYNFGIIRFDLRLDENIVVQLDG